MTCEYFLVFFLKVFYLYLRLLSVEGMLIIVVNKIRYLFKVKLFTIRSETKKKRETESKTLNIY